MSKHDQIDAPAIGRRVKELRENAGMSQAELAVETGYKTSEAIRKLEQGERAPLGPLIAIADHFGVSLDWLTGRQEASKSKPEPPRLAGAIRSARERRKPNVPARPTDSQAPSTHRKKGQGASGR